MRSAVPCVLFALGVGACSMPRMPDVEPVALNVTAIGSDGVTAQVELDVRNPNSFEVSARTVTARVMVAERYALGPVTIPQGISIPACSTVRLSVPFKATWSEAPVLAPLALSPAGVPYQATGSVTVGSAWLHLEVPFEKRGTIPQTMLISGAVRSLGIPGLGGR